MYLSSLFTKFIALVIGLIKGLGGVMAALTLLVVCFQISNIPLYLGGSALLSFLLFPIVACLFYYFHTLIPQSSNLRFGFIIRQKIIVILFVTTAIILPSKLLIPGFYDGLRFVTFISMLIFGYEEFRRSYLLNKSRLGFRQRYFNDFTEILGEFFEPIVWIVLYSFVVVVMNPFSIFYGIQRGTWIILDTLIVSVLWFSLLRDFKIGQYLYKEYYLLKKSIEEHNDISLELKLYVCEEYSIGSHSLPKVNYSSENLKIYPFWSEKEKAILGIDLDF